jgi:hypothetical protein
MRMLGLIARLAASLVGGACTYAFAVALLMATSFGDFAGRFASALSDLMTAPFAPADAGAAFSIVPYVFVAAMTAFYFAFPLVSDLLRKRAGSL